VNRLLPYIKFKHEPSADYWESQWKGLDPAIYAQMIESSNNPLLRLLNRYLPRSGAILDGGCGMGQWSILLRNRGYSVTGLDFDSRTISWLQNYQPDINWETGTIFCLPFSDNQFEAYISLGVLEHQENKYLDSIREAHRVLKDQGILFLSVPYYSPFLRLLGAYQTSNSGFPFYQYYFSRKELVDILRRLSFEITEVITIDPILGIFGEIPWLGSLYSFLQRAIATVRIGHKEIGTVDSLLRRSLSRLLRILHDAVNNFPFFRRWFGHMIVVVCSKQNTV
jgi:2-polyprenyl-3-methyl-5-hydroxy-6-metoxy-1,4-benzoquinol methylase